MQTIADVRRSNKYRECIPLMKPDDPGETISSAMKAIQTLLDTLVGKIDGFLSTAKSFVDDAAGAMNSADQVKDYMKKLGCQMAKYMKVVTDKMMEYTNKVMNEGYDRCCFCNAFSLEISVCRCKGTVFVYGILSVFQTIR